MPEAVRWCVTGASGQLGSVLARRLAVAGRNVLALSHRHSVEIGDLRTVPVDLTDKDATWRVLAEARPNVVVHLAAVAAVGDALNDPARARAVNVEATASLVDQADRLGARFIHTSTDLVFDGQDPPYDESAQPNPLSCYGRAKLEAEAAVLACRRGVVVRPSLMFGLPAVTRATTFGLQLAALRDGLELKLFEDEFRTALWLEDAARAIEAIGRSDFVGLLHLAGPERISRLEMGLAMAKALGLSSDRIRPVSSASMSFPEPRPSDVSLDGARLRETFSDLPAPLTVFQATGRITPEQLAALPTAG